MNKAAFPGLAISLTFLSLLCSCAPQREFVRFGDPGTFHPGRPESAVPFSGPEGEYDSYELIDRGAPNQGIPAMYSGRQGGYPVIVPNPW